MRRIAQVVKEFNAHPAKVRDENAAEDQALTATRAPSRSCYLQRTRSKHTHYKDQETLSPQPSVRLEEYLPPLVAKVMEAASARYAARDRFGGFGEPAQTPLQRYIRKSLEMDFRNRANG